MTKPAVAAAAGATAAAGAVASGGAVNRALGWRLVAAALSLATWALADRYYRNPPGIILEEVTPAEVEEDEEEERVEEAAALEKAIHELGEPFR